MWEYHKGTEEDRGQESLAITEKNEHFLSLAAYQDSSL